MSVEPFVAVVGAGPAGLMAAERLSAAGVRVRVFERMPSVGRKFLLAGRGGLNLTHSEPAALFTERYGAAADWMRPHLEAFSGQDLIAWAHSLGQETFIGSSGRVFPAAMKASPLLRAWLRRLQDQGVEISTGRRWRGWDADGRLVFDQEPPVEAVATVLALGGGSWPRLGSDGGWLPLLAEAGVTTRQLRPANCGFSVAWTEHFRERFHGQPLKGVSLHAGGRTVRGEVIITRYGVEGGPIYALSGALRDQIEAEGHARLLIDLRPDMPVPAMVARLTDRRAGASMSDHLRRALALSPVAVGLMREMVGLTLPNAPEALAKAVKRSALQLSGVQPIDRAISSVGGVALSDVDETLMLRSRPGVFVAGEMLDWDAPTGGYLLQACFATGAAAAKGVLARLKP